MFTPINKKRKFSDTRDFPVWFLFLVSQSYSTSCTYTHSQTHWLKGDLTPIFYHIPITAFTAEPDIINKLKYPESIPNSTLKYLNEVEYRWRKDLREYERETRKQLAADRRWLAGESRALPTWKQRLLRLDQVNTWRFKKWLPLVQWQNPTPVKTDPQITEASWIIEDTTVLKQILRQSQHCLNLIPPTLELIYWEVDNCLGDLEFIDVFLHHSPSPLPPLPLHIPSQCAACNRGLDCWLID